MLMVGSKDYTREPLARGLVVLLQSWQVFLTGALLGISIAAPPGPVNAAAAFQLTRSWLAGWATLLGATTADAIFFFLTYFGVTRLVEGGWVREVFFAAGGVLLLYLGLSTMRNRKREPGAQGTRDGRTPYLTGLTIGLSNPFQLAWWVAVGVGMVATFGLSIIAGFFAGIIAWTLAYSTMLRVWLRRYERVYPYIVYASSLILLGFGLWFLFTAATSL